MEYLRGASVAKIKTELASYKEQVELFKIEQMSKDSNFLDESLTAGKSNLFYNTQKEEEQGNGKIKDVIENISDSYFEKMEIIKGELLINTKDNNEIEIAQSLGINVNPYDIDENGVLLSTGNNLALMDENGTVTIPDNVTEIGEGAFANEGLKTIIIPGTVKKIQANAFAYNSTLETVIMQEGVEEIGEEAFLACGKARDRPCMHSLRDPSPRIRKNPSFTGRSPGADLAARAFSHFACLVLQLKQKGTGRIDRVLPWTRDTFGQDCPQSGTSSS